MNVEVSIGEAVDKFTILTIKLRKITDNDKLNNVANEYILLKAAIDDLKIDFIDRMNLEEVNEQLWVIEDKLREKEKLAEFDAEFISLARMVYKTNDLRATIKKGINNKYGSAIVEEKSYVM